MMAAARGRTAVVHELVHAGGANLRPVDLDQSDVGGGLGRTALDWAVDNKHADAEAILVAAMAREDKVLLRGKKDRAMERSLRPRVPAAPLDPWNGDPLAIVKLCRINTFYHGANGAHECQELVKQGVRALNKCISPQNERIIPLFSSVPAPPTHHPRVANIMRPAPLHDTLLHTYGFVLP